MCCEAVTYAVTGHWCCCNGSDYSELLLVVDLWWRQRAVSNCWGSSVQIWKHIPKETKSSFGGWCLQVDCFSFLKNAVEQLKDRRRHTVASSHYFSSSNSAASSMKFVVLLHRWTPSDHRFQLFNFINLLWNHWLDYDGGSASAYLDREVMFPFSLHLNDFELVQIWRLVFLCLWMNTIQTKLHRFYIMYFLLRAEP